MSERVIISALVCATMLLCTFIAGLVMLAIFRDGQDESAIIGAIVGLPALLAATVGPIVAHYLGTKAAKTP